MEIQLRRLQARLAERKMVLEVTDKAKSVLATEGFDPVYGARPLKRVIQRRIENELAMRLLQGEFGEGAAVRVDAAPTGELLFEPVVVGEPVAA